MKNVVNTNCITAVVLNIDNVRPNKTQGTNRVVKPTEIEADDYKTMFEGNMMKKQP